MLGPQDIPAAMKLGDKLLLKTLERIRNKLELSKEDWARSYMRIAQEDYDDILVQKQDLSALALFHLTEKLWINPSDLESGSIDYDSLSNLQKGQKNYIHPRYTIAAKSRKHTVLNSLNFVESHRGPHLRNMINRHFQIHSGYWNTEPMAPINIRFVADLMDFLGCQGFNEESFRAMGMNSFLTLKNTRIGEKLSLSSGPKELYEQLVYESIHQIEDNCSYRISHMSESECIIESVSNLDVTDALGIRHTGNANVCRYRAGVFMSLPGHIGIRPASVMETHCVHRGDACCRFVVDFSLHRIRDNGVRLSPVI